MMLRAGAAAPLRQPQFATRARCVTRWSFPPWFTGPHPDVSTPVVVVEQHETRSETVAGRRIQQQQHQAPPLIEERDELRNIAFGLQTLTSVLITGTAIYCAIQFTKSMSGRSDMMHTPGLSSLESGSAKRVTFSMIAGLDEAKHEVYELVDFLKTPEKFSKVGAVVPKGVLLVGPPGTGKTLLAQAIAGEAGVPFFACSASGFVQMWAGLGAARIRQLFADAKAKAPCIVFIDELDAVGKARSTVSFAGTGNEEREQTINQLLTEMNGFEANAGVIVVAATNRAEILDKALLRPGRFDRQVTVGLPDARGREAILRVHVANKPLAADVDLQRVARATPSFSGADLQQLANEAAIHAARAGRDGLAAEDFDSALEKITLGLERKGAYMSEHKRRLVAVHESGHALAALLLEDFDEVRKVTIAPRGQAGGVTHFVPSQERIDMGLYTRDYLFKQLVVALAGRAAEEVAFGPGGVTTGAAADMQRVHQIARAMVVQYGFSERLGRVHWPAPDSGESLLSHETAAAIDDEIRKLADSAYMRALTLMRERHCDLKVIATALVERETLTGEEVAALLRINPDALT